MLDQLMNQEHEGVTAMLCLCPIGINHIIFAIITKNMMANHDASGGIIRGKVDQRSDVFLHDEVQMSRNPGHREGPAGM